MDPTPLLFGPIVLGLVAKAAASKVDKGTGRAFRRPPPVETFDVEAVGVYLAGTWAVTVDGADASQSSVRSQGSSSERPCTPLVPFELPLLLDPTKASKSTSPPPFIPDPVALAEALAKVDVCSSARRIARRCSRCSRSTRLPSDLITLWLRASAYAQTNALSSGD